MDFTVKYEAGDGIEAGRYAATMRAGWFGNANWDRQVRRTGLLCVVFFLLLLIFYQWYAQPDAHPVLVWVFAAMLVAYVVRLVLLFRTFVGVGRAGKQWEGQLVNGEAFQLRLGDTGVAVLGKGPLAGEWAWSEIDTAAETPRHYLFKKGERLVAVLPKGALDGRAPQVEAYVQAYLVDHAKKVYREKAAPAPTTAGNKMLDTLKRSVLGVREETAPDERKNDE